MSPGTSKVAVMTLTELVPMFLSHGKICHKFLISNVVIFINANDPF
jgi:hypothetical protein